MDYEQKYKEAFKRARKSHDNANGLIKKEWIETIFPELKMSEDEKIRKELINYFKYGVLTPEHPERKLIESWIAWLEKQDERKPIDKIEPKFKVGDWILIDNPCQIESIDSNGNYIVRYCDAEETHLLSRNFCDSHFHLWTIEDAKDGDVLVIGNEYFLFKEKKENTSPAVYISHCFADSAGAFRVTNGRDCGEFLSIENGVKACPATKEQRDFLFQKIKEAGYEWDADKKVLVTVGIDNDKEDERYEELMKDNETDLNIKQNSANSYCKENCKGYQETRKCFADGECKAKKDAEQNIEEEFDDFFNLESVIDIVEMYGKGEVDLYGSDVTSELEWLKSLRDRLQPQQKQEWSKEDEYQINTILHELDLKKEIYKKEGNKVEEERYNTQYNWLKSIKDKVQPHWKPTQEQISILYWILTNIQLEINDENIIESLYCNLKKL